MRNTKEIVDLGERGKFNPKNKLNDLTGKEWIKFTKSWFIHRPIKRKRDEKLHPAKFPESLAQNFIEFFTKKNQWILDPFAGTGSTLIAAGRSNRNAIGIELLEKYSFVAENRIRKENFKKKIFVIQDSSHDLINLLIRNNHSNLKFDYVITSPPYWSQLKRNHIRQQKRKTKGYDTMYSNEQRDLGNINDYEEFLSEQAKVFDQVFEVIKDRAYLTVITNNIYYNGKLYPLAFDTAKSLTQRGKHSWILKDEKIWLQDDKSLVALGINNAWVGNRHHQYCLIFRKEENKNE